MIDRDNEYRRRVRQLEQALGAEQAARKALAARVHVLELSVDEINNELDEINNELDDL